MGRECEEKIKDGQSAEIKMNQIIENKQNILQINSGSRCGEQNKEKLN